MVQDELDKVAGLVRDNGKEMGMEFPVEAPAAAVLGPQANPDYFSCSKMPDFDVPLLMDILDDIDVNFSEVRSVGKIIALKNSYLRSNTDLII